MGEREATANGESCTPEWCEQGGPEHDDVCDNAPMGSMTKRDFVERMRSAAAQAIDAYVFMLVEEGFDPELSKEEAIAEVAEVAACFAGIGSCGRGWCRHG